MSDYITLKTHNHAYRDENGQYHYYDAVSDGTTAQRIAQINTQADNRIQEINQVAQTAIETIPPEAMQIKENLDELKSDTIRLFDLSNIGLQVGGLDTTSGVITDVKNRARSAFLNIAKGQTIRTNDGFKFFVLKFGWDNAFISSDGWHDNYIFNESVKCRLLFKNDSITDMSDRIEELSNAIDADSFTTQTADSIKRLNDDVTSIIQDYGYYINISNPPRGCGLIPCIKNDSTVDNAQALQGIMDYAIAHNRGIIVDGVYYIGSTLFVKSGLQLHGINTDASKIIWNGATNTTMIAFDDGDAVRNVNIENLTISGDNKAHYGVKIYSAFYCGMKNVIIRDCKANCLRIIPITQKEAEGAQWCVFTNLSLINADTPLWLDSTNPLSNVCHNTFISLNLEYIGDGIYAGDCDNNTFIETFTFCYAEDKKYGVKFTANARNNYFYHFQGTCYAFNGSRNVIYEYDVENNQALPVIDGEAKLFYTSLSPARSLMRFGGCSDTSSLPTNTANIGDCIYYRWPKAGGYIGAVYTSNGWKEFGKIQA